MARLTWCVAAVLSVACASALAQEAPSPGGAPPMSSAPSAAQEVTDAQPTLRVNVNLVNTYFSVRDKNGFITDLTKDACTVREDGNPQTIKNFTTEKSLPLTIGILLDTSGSMERMLPMEQDAGSEFLKDVLTPKDEAFLITFDVNVDLLADYTNNQRELDHQIRKARINTSSSSGGIPGIGGGPVPTSNPRGTLLYDAVYLAAHDKLRPEAGRKVIVMLTDGVDQGSQETLKSSIETAQKANAIVYVILVEDRSFYSNGGIAFGGGGGGYMKKLAEESGGRMIDVGSNGKKLKDAFTQISDELRTQYLMSYTSTNLKLDGTFRKQEIECGKGLKVQARRGYYAIDEAAKD
ncbi:VWA domain-containing protein [Terriglobus albidus]|uniref:VWA domain-containing protein n=1 Tax=Terriglobus albidus TaxID=1592106 RepID=A0A5B9EFD6_9BACT|nr:VWA domain-containing protein [Terriglobus albidus]QEE30943.1 VWA domain-containing protein [Terriglobus albidus]